ncbi:MAG: hypothetical protein U0V73_00940 [Acidimicrobiia bacterium]
MRIGRPVGIAVVALLGVLGGVDACAGHRPTGLDHHTYVHRVNTVCSRTNDRIRALTPPDPLDPASSLVTTRSAIELQRRAVDSIAALRPSAPDRQTASSWLEVEPRALDAEAAIVAAIAAEDQHRIDEATRRARELESRARRLAQRLGLQACASSSA